MIKEKIGVMGIGNMGSAILEGLISKKLARPSQIWIYDKMRPKVTKFSRRWKVNAAKTPIDVIDRCHVVLLAVKPQDLAAAGADLKRSFRSSQLVITILAGTPISKVRQVLGTQPKIVRAMPNLGAKVGQGITALTGRGTKPLSLAAKIFSGCGKTIQLNEKYFDLVTAISGSGPAYYFFLMELLVKIGTEQGLPKKSAELLAVQTAVGAGLLAQASMFSPEELRRMVTSKGGTTEAALKVLEKQKFPAIFRKAIKAAVNRGRELSH